MADPELKKISDLVELTELAAGDLVPSTDISEPLDINKTKKLLWSTIEKYLSLVTEIQTDVARTFSLTDAGKLIALTGSTGRTFTVPPNSDVPFLIGTVIALTKDGTGDLTIAQGIGVTIRTEVGLILTAQYAMATIIKIDTNIWRAGGSLNAA